MGSPWLRSLALLLAVSALGVAVSVGTGFLNLASSLLLWLVVSASIAVAGELAGGALRLGPENRGRLRLVVAGLCIALLGAELFLRVGVGRYDNYFERNRRNPRIRALPWLVDYRSIFPEPADDWIRVYRSNSRSHWEQAEFDHDRVTNSLGLTGGEPPPRSEATGTRILVLGDSFVEGVGADVDETWVRVMRDSLRVARRDPGLHTVNAGIAGSDPFYDFVLLRDRLVSLDPDLVLVAVNHSDLLDVVLRGGFERFQPDGRRVHPRTGPGWEWLYALSHLVRHVVHDLLGYDRLLMRPAEAAAARRRAVADLDDAVSRFEELTRRAGIGLGIVVHPFERHVESGYPSDFAGWLRRLEAQRRPPVLDVLSVWRTQRHVAPRDAAGLYWRNDLHHNAAGYRLLGETVAAWLAREDILPDQGRKRGGAGSHAP